MDIAIRAMSFAGKRVLGAIRLTVGSGERVAILRPSGLGKTTFLRVAAGLDRDFTGAVTTAIVFQEPTLLPWRTALQNISLPTIADEAHARGLLADVGLADHEAL